MTFEQRQIYTETLGQYLTVLRIDRGLDLVSVAKSLGIAPKFLEALEKGAYDMLPADVYVLGFLQKLAGLYQVEPVALLDQFKKERAAFSGEIKIKRESEKAGIRIQFTPRMLSALIVGGLLLILGTYVIWQIARLNQPPSLEITSPKDGEKITQTFVTVSGKTEPGMKLTINDEQVLVDDAGKFSASLGIGSGQKQLVIRSQNKFDKVTTRIVNVVGELPAANGEVKTFTLDVIALQKIKISYVVDGKPEQTENLDTGTTKKITAETTILLSTTDAGDTQVLMNGKNLGVLGKPGESLNLIPFTAGTTDVIPVTKTSVTASSTPQ